MTERRSDEAPTARVSPGGPAVDDAGAASANGEGTRRDSSGSVSGPRQAIHAVRHAKDKVTDSVKHGNLSGSDRGSRTAETPKARPQRTRKARLRLVQVDAWSVMKTSFLLSIALGIVMVVAVGIIWTVLGSAGVWDSINSMVGQAVGGEATKPFEIQDYLGTGRVLGFTMILAVLDVILLTAIATLGAFLYNLAAALLGGIEVTLAEDH